MIVARIDFLFNIAFGQCFLLSLLNDADASLHPNSTESLPCAHLVFIFFEEFMTRIYLFAAGNLLVFKGNLKL